MKKYKYVIVEKENHICTFTFNRPDRYNAFNWEMEHEVFEAFKDVDADKDIRVIILTGAGVAFSTGADIQDMLQANIDQGGLTGEETYDMPFRHMVPIIAAINGFCIGAGLTITTQCDFRIAAEEARFSLPFVPIGAMPEAGSTYFLPRLIGMSNALDLALTGRTFKAKEAKELGLISQVVPGAMLRDTVFKLAKQIAAAPPQAVKATKQAFYQGLESNIAAAIENEKNTLMWLLKTEDHKEAVKAYMEKRPAVFKGK